MERRVLIPSDEVLVDTVARHPGSTWRELILVFNEDGWPSITRSQLNSRLYRLQREGYLDWEPGIGSERRWYCERLLEEPGLGANLPPAAEEASSFDIERFLKEFHRTNVEERAAPEEIELYDWQKEALEEWEDCGYEGVIEAVTGAGKTRVALAATADVLRDGGKVAIVVPTVDLLHQWKREIERLIIDTLRLRISIGVLGDGQFSNLSRCDLLLATVQSACQNYLLPDSVPGHVESLLIADEVHRYGSERWSWALESEFDMRLGLTATYERSDNGCEDHLDPYFGGVIFSVDYERALSEGIIAPFKIAFMGVPFSPDEREEYEEYDKKVSKYRRRLVNEYGLPEEPFGEFMRAVTLFSKSGEEGAKWAGFYLNAFTQRRKVLANARSKYDRLATLIDAVRQADKTIIFAQTKEAAEVATRPFIEGGINGAVLESGMKRPERKQVLAGFESDEFELVAAPKLLDEGIDVAAADLAIIIAASRSRRQMIQRMGRVLRLKEDGRFARVVVLYVQDTSEDPDVAHEGFLDLVTGVAHDIKDFSSEVSPAEVCNYLSP